MKKSILSLLLLPFLSWGLSIVSPRCEFVENPIGLANRAPLLSWTFKDVKPQDPSPDGIEVHVASSPADLSAGRNLHWSTRIMVPADFFSLEYQGEPLQSGTPYFWQVRMLGKEGQPVTGWSAPARFSLALQNSKEWENAQWIGDLPNPMLDVKNPTIDVRLTLKKKAIGILFHASDKFNAYMWQLNASTGKLCFRPHRLLKGQWELLSEVPLQEKFFPNIDLSEPILMKIVTQGDLIRTAINGIWISEIRDGTFTSGTIGLRTSDGEAASIDEITVINGDGKVLLRDTFDSPDERSFPQGKIANGSLHLENTFTLLSTDLPKNCPRYRRGFELPDKPVRHAFVSVCGLGFYELYLNGKKASDAVLAPPNTPYRKRLLFDTIDVTRFLQSGNNRIGLWLAPGYSDDYSQWGWRWEFPKRALLHLAVTFEDGTRQTIVSDPKWEYTNRSPLTYASIYHGEIYDASLRDPEWSTPADSSRGWKPAAVLPSQEIPLAANDMPPVIASDPRKPIKITEPRRGVFVADIGQNRAGWTKIRAKGAKGTRITLRHSELLGWNGFIDPWTNRKAEATDTFILAGTGEWEYYEPRFTYHGFRYVQIEGYPGTPTTNDITGLAVHADLEENGSFDCSDETLNKLYLAAKWSMLSNLQGIPTDCAARDERTPCQMDSQAYEDSAIQYFNMARYYSKWLEDIRGSRGEPDWHGDFTMLSWRLYQFYGDLHFLEKGYPEMKAYVESVFLPSYPAHRFKKAFGDWCRPNNNTWEGFHGDPELVNAALFCRMLQITANTAELLGKPDERDKYRAWAVKMTDLLQKEMFHEKEGRYMSGSQTTSLLPLAFDLVPYNERGKVRKHLLKTIREKDKSKLDTGIFGTRYIGDVLCDLGEEDLAVQLFTQKEYPGFGSLFACGATTLWEQWTYKGGMNSHNHAMFSGAAYMLFTRIGGILPAAPGYAKIKIDPVFPKDLKFAKTSRQTPRGLCTTFWERNENGIELTVTIPPFTPATLYLPGQAPQRLKSGKNVVSFSR